MQLSPQSELRGCVPVGWCLHAAPDGIWRREDSFSLVRGGEGRRAGCDMSRLPLRWSVGPRGLYAA